MIGIGLMFPWRTEQATRSVTTAAQVLIGLGGGVLNAPAQLGVQASAGHQHVGTATAMFLTLISVGGSVGTAISNGVWSRMVLEKLPAYLPEGAQDEVMDIFSDVDRAVEYPVGSLERDAIIRSYKERMETLVTIALCFCALVIICSLFMRDYNLKDMRQGVKGRVIGGQIEADEMTRRRSSRPHVEIEMNRGRMHSV
jgi:hypothetical protein